MSTISHLTQESVASQSDERVALVMRQVGARVRALREARGLPRRVLSNRSGVSPRYLAQLEAGEGNISIGLLQRVAMALDHSIVHLLGDSGTAVARSESSIEALFEAASEEVQHAVLRLLTGQASAPQRAQRICLVGLRGAGKSTLGARMSAAFDVPFVELNREIESHSGMPVAEVMALYGQEGYRSLEARAVERVIALHDRVILAVAGGIVAEADTYNTLLAHFHTVWIRTSPEEHMARVRAQGDERPMAGNPEAMLQLKSILTAREALYARAQAQMDTSGRAIETSVKELQELIERRGFLG